MPIFIWLAIAAVMAIIELLSFGLISVWFIVGALASFVAAWLGASTYVQVVLFIAVSVGCLIIFRPIAMKYRNKGEAKEPTLVGKQGIVVEKIDNDALTGRIELSDRVTWTARSIDGSVIDAGERVVVKDQQSIKLIVERIES
jgi:membrane protein implicated in regulation of membrane protease activity